MEFRLAAKILIGKTAIMANITLNINKVYAAK